MHLVVGATGSLGSEICRRLRSRGEDVCALVRSSSDPALVSRLRDLGVETVEGDLRDPESLSRACQGIRTVISTVTSIRSRQPGDSFAETDEQGQANLIESAIRSGVRRFVYISFSGNMGGDDGMTRAKRKTEERLAGSGMQYFILRPSVFMEVWLSPHTGFDHPNAKVTLFGSGDAPISWISAGDVAEFAALAAVIDETESSVLELGGPEALSAREVVRLFERETGRSFAVNHVPVDALEEQARSAEPEIPRTFATLQLSCARGDAIPMQETLRRFPVQLTTVEEYVRRVTQARPG